MSGTETVVVDLAQGEVRFGTRQITIECTAQPHRFRLPDGRFVRAITFGERSRVLRDALAANDPGTALLELLHGLALEGAPDQVASAVLLALAGGGEAAPGFDECAEEACRLRAWGWRALNDSAAIDVDRCVQVRVDGGWTRFAFASSPAEDQGNALAWAVREMTERLLERAAAVGEPDVPRPSWLRDSNRVQSVSGQAGEPGTIARPMPSGGPEELLRASTEIRRNDARPAAIGFVWRNPGASAKQRAPQSPDAQTTVVARARFRLRRERTAPHRQSEPSRDTVAPGCGGFDPARAQPIRPVADWSGFATDAADAGTLPTFTEPVQVLVRESNWGEQPQTTASPGAKSQAQPRIAPPAADWLDEIARALADECDLRGID